MKNLKISKNAQDLYRCFSKGGVVVGGNKTKIIEELLDTNLIMEIKKGKDKGKFCINSKNLN